jgi:hypothetical protein
MERDEFLDQQQLAERLRLSPRTLERQRQSGGGIPYVKAGRRVLYRWTDALDWLDQRRVGSTSEAGR